MEQTYMKEKPILPLLLSMAAPMILSMLVNSLYNIIDSIFVAQISEDAMTALSLVFPIQNVVNSVAVGFGIGINVMIAICNGANQREQADKAASQGMFLSVIHGIILSIIGILIMPSFLKLFTSNQDTLSLGLRYSNIVLLFAVVINVEITFEKYFQAMGMMVVSMLSMLFGCILNIILDPVLIFGIGPFPRLGIEGAAIATGIGQCSTLLIYILFYIFKKLPVKIRKNLLRPEKNVCIRLYSVGIPGALNMALPSLLISALNGILASISETGVIILGIYYKLQTFLYLSVNGMIQGMRPLMGYNYGAKEYKRVNKIYRLALTIAIGIMAVGTLLFMFTPETFMKMFTTQETTIAAGASALRIISCGFIVSSVSVVSSGALEALGKGNESLVVSLLRYLIIIVPLAFILSRFLGATGVWHAFWVTETVTAFVAYGIYRKALHNK